MFCEEQEILTAINSDMVINKKTLHFVEAVFIGTGFIGTVFVGTVLI